MQDRFKFTSTGRITLLALIGVLLLTTILGFAFGSGDRIWSNLLINSYYFIGMALAAIFMLATHTIGWGGWHVVIKRVWEGMGAFIPIGGILILVILAGTAFNWHHLYHWTDNFVKQEHVTVGELRDYEEDIMAHHAADTHGEEGHGDAHAEEGHGDEHATAHTGDHAGEGEHGGSHTADADHTEEAGHGEHGPHFYADEYAGVDAATEIENPHYDKILAGKEWYLNMGFYAGRIIAYVLLWVLMFFLIRRASVQEDLNPGMSNYKKQKIFSALYLLVFGVTSSTSSWDLIMSVDPHWYSTLFGWYNFASYTVAGLALTSLIVMHLKNRGYLQEVNENHLHDIGKFMFGFSVFWTYLWFSQFLLIWYGNIPEETVYYATRLDDPWFKAGFFALFLINFAFPFLVLMTRGSKRATGFMGVSAVVIIIGHWLDFYMMVSPGVLGDEAGFGFTEIAMGAGFMGLFLFAAYTAMSRAKLVPENNPYLKESLQHHT